MAGFTDTVKQAIKEAYCSNVRSSPDWFSALRRIVVPDGLADAADAFNRAVCNSTDNASDDIPPPPFTGGQCANKLYNVFARRVRSTGPFITPPPGTGCADDGIIQIGFSLQGPIRSIRIVETTTDQFGFITDRWSIAHGVSSEFNLGGILRGCPTAGFKEFSVVPTVGPDDCGDPPPELPEPGPIVVNPPDITYDDDDGNPITVPIGIIFAPVLIRANGQITIPVSVDVGGINLTGNFDLFPNAEINLFPDAVINRPGTPDNPDLTDPEPGSDGQPDEEEDQSGVDPIVAVVVRSNQEGFTRASEVAQEDLPTLFAPRLGNVSFYTTTGGIGSWTPFQPIQSTNQYIPCPDVYGAVDVKVWWDAGWTGSYTAIRGKPLGAGV